MTSGHLLQQLENEMSRVRERISVSEGELQRLVAERQEQESLIGSRQAELTTVAEARTQFEMQLAAGQDRLAALRNQRDAAAESTSQRAARVATLEERHRSATTLLQRIETLVSEMGERAGALQIQMESASAELAPRQNQNVQLAEQFLQFEAERNTGECGEGL